MNKIIQINLAGQAVSIDEIAYQSLSHYLQTLEQHFANMKDGKEILADIESRIAELFFGKIKKGNSFINKQDVDEAIKLMGTPEDMGIEDDEPNQQKNYTKSTAGRKLFRDTEDRVLGGVCSGLGAYLDMDTSLVRIIVVLLIIFTGIPLIAYFVLWAIVPEATTPNDRFRMQGGNTTVNDIVNNVRTEATDIARTVKNEANNVAENLKKNSNLKQSGSSVVNGLEQITRFFAKIFGAGTLIVLVIVGVALSIFLLANATGGLTLNAGDMDVVTPSILRSPTLNWIFSISLSSLVLIPIGTLCYAIILFIFNMDVRLNIKAVFLSWLLSLAIFIGISIYSAGDVNVKSFKEFGEKIRNSKFKLGDNDIYYDESYKLESDTSKQDNPNDSITTPEIKKDTSLAELQWL